MIKLVREELTVECALFRSRSPVSTNVNFPYTVLGVGVTLCIFRLWRRAPFFFCSVEFHSCFAFISHVYTRIDCPIMARLFLTWQTNCRRSTTDHHMIGEYQIAFILGPIPPWPLCLSILFVYTVSFSHQCHSFVYIYSQIELHTLMNLI